MAFPLDVLKKRTLQAGHHIAVSIAMHNFQVLWSGLRPESRPMRISSAKSLLPSLSSFASFSPPPGAGGSGGEGGNANRPLQICSDTGWDRDSQVRPPGPSREPPGPACGGGAPACVGLPCGTPWACLWDPLGLSVGLPGPVCGTPWASNSNSTNTCSTSGSPVGLGLPLASIEVVPAPAVPSLQYGCACL